MIQVAELIREVQADGLRLRVEGVGLVVEGDDQARARWREALLAAKPAIIAELTAAEHDARAPVPTPTAEQPARAGTTRPVDASCASCQHVSRFGNCGEPKAAGLAERFALVQHPDDGRGCTAFAAHPDELDRRLTHLLAIGAIDDADAQLARERWHAYPAEWRMLLDACEAAHRRDSQ